MLDRLAFALWVEFGYADPTPDGHRPRLLDADDPYWTAAAERLYERFPGMRDIASLRKPEQSSAPEEER